MRPVELRYFAEVDLIMILLIAKTDEIKLRRA